MLILNEAGAFQQVHPLTPRLGFDLEWAIDHSRRRYRVRPSHPDDHPGLRCGAGDIGRSITVVRLHDARRLVFAAACSAFPTWADTDAWAAQRWADRRGAFR